MTSQKPGAEIFELGNDLVLPGSNLPEIWITYFDEEFPYGKSGRNYLGVYPSAMSMITDEEDTDGNLALSLGADYYNEGMSYSAASHHQERIDCFRAAEILYRHAAYRGNLQACTNLAYIYSYDRCEGHYWVNPDTLIEAEDYTRPFPVKEEAFRYCKIAADGGVCEAMYKLGDFYKKGLGCQANAENSFAYYEKAVAAVEANDGEPESVWASAYQRLAECYENGFGCEQNFTLALQNYKRAEIGFDLAIKNGEHYYQNVFGKVKASVLNIQQEIHGGY